MNVGMTNAIPIDAKMIVSVIFCIIKNVIIRINMMIRMISSAIQIFFLRVYLIISQIENKVIRLAFCVLFNFSIAFYAETKV